MRHSKLTSIAEIPDKKVGSPDCTDPEVNTDKTEIDTDADKTVKKNSSAKSKLETNPDSTGIDTKADKTKKETEVEIDKK